MKKTILSHILIIFTLLAVPVPGLATVDISDIEVEFEDEKTVTISWRTNKVTSGKVLFGKSKDILAYCNES